MRSGMGAWSPGSEKWLDLITDLGRDVTREEYLGVSMRRQRRANSGYIDIPEGL